MPTVNVTKGELYRCLAAGFNAAASGHPVTVCPYDQDGNPEQGMRAAAWIRGYARQRRQTRRAHLTVVK